MLESYYQKAEERKKLGLPPLPLTPEETSELCQLLEDPPAGHEEELVYLIEQRISPGVDPAAMVKASWLEEIALQKRQSPLINPLRAVFLLGTMLGGYNVGPLVSFLQKESLAPEAARALAGIILVYGSYRQVVDLSSSNQYAREVLQSWSEADWFRHRPEFPEKIVL
ncbi:MAG TPA: aconitate hydratase B, partial [Candidatus Saccharicenans sp.]|nr:aconitate hydratase B [Candidatus Saccharicenans sp.]